MKRRELHADLETPVSAYLKLARDRPSWSFLFESVEGDEVWASYSILGFGAKSSYVVNDGKLQITRAGQTQTVDAPNCLQALRQAIGNDRKLPAGTPGFVGGVFGFLSYDAVRDFERLPGVPGEPTDPTLCFVEPELLAVFDNRRHTLTLYADDEAQIDRGLAELSAPVVHQPQPSPWIEPKALDSAETYRTWVEATKEHIRAGDIIQAVLSRRFAIPKVADSFDVYRGLRTINPSPYLFFYRTPDFEIAGASPEVMIRVVNGQVVVRPIAGTRPRGATPDEDLRLEKDLLADPKECAEHIMLVDLGRNDVGRVSRPGTVEVPNLMVVERYSHVMHIVSEVHGELDENKDAFDALQAAFPAGTLSGAPKVRAMQIIDSLEQRPRGIYGGAVGYFGVNGNADFGIAIRTLVCRDDQMIVSAGAGIVADSDPQKETEETEHKAAAVLQAARWASQRKA